jgi:hypothetical protein
MNPYRFDDRWTFDVAPQVLWATITRTEDYAAWWPSVSGAQHGVGAGSTGRWTVRGPLPYHVRFATHIESAVSPRSIRCRVTGDVEGFGVLEILPTPGGSEAHLVWEVRVRRPLLRALSTVARPVLRWAHDRVIAEGVRAFRAKALPS